MVTSNLCHGYYKLACPSKDCQAYITRNIIKQICSNDALICYDTLKFISDMSQLEDDKLIYFCSSCCHFSLRYHQQSRKCSKCDKRMEKLKNLFTLIKLLLSSKTSQSCSKKDYQTIRHCVNECEKSIQRCDTCMQWKHRMSTLALKCIC